MIPTDSSALSTASANLAAYLLMARASGRYAAFGKAHALGSIEEAYRVQKRVADDLGTAVPGWKVGITPEGERFAAPIFACDVVAPGAPFVLAGSRAEVLVEVELALRLKNDLPPRPGQPYTRADVLAATEEMFCGIELVAMHFTNFDDVSFETRLADNFANAAYVCGSGTQDFDGIDPAALHCMLTQDGKSIADHIGGHPLKDPLLPVIEWANHQCDLLGGMRAGQFITTGTLNEPLRVSGPASLSARLAKIGDAALDIIARG